MITRLSDIIDSGSQAELLAFFLTATPRSFPVSELSRRLKISPHGVQTAASSLEKQNILKTFSKQGVKFYLVNQKHAMIPQLKKSLVKEHQEWPDELLTSLKKLGNLSGIFLSGVFVGKPELVVDLLLVGTVNKAKLAEFLKMTRKQFGGEINYSIMSMSEFMIRRDTFDRFIKDIFDYPHIVLLEKTEGSAPVAAPEPAPVAKPSVVTKSVEKKKSIKKKKSVKKAKPIVALVTKQVKKESVKKPAPKKVVHQKVSSRPVVKKAVKKSSKIVVKKSAPVKKALPVKKNSQKPVSKKVVRAVPKTVAKKTTTKKTISKKTDKKTLKRKR